MPSTWSRGRSTSAPPQRRGRSRLGSRRSVASPRRQGSCSPRSLPMATSATEAAGLPGTRSLTRARAERAQQRGAPASGADHEDGQRPCAAAARGERLALPPPAADRRCAAQAQGGPAGMGGGARRWGAGAAASPSAAPARPRQAVVGGQCRRGARTHGLHLGGAAIQAGQRAAARRDEAAHTGSGSGGAPLRGRERMDGRWQDQEDARRSYAAAAPGAVNPRCWRATPPGAARSCGQASGNPRESEWHAVAAAFPLVHLLPPRAGPPRPLPGASGAASPPVTPYQL